MKILFIHPNMPGQYKHLARIYGLNPAHQVVFICKEKEIDIPGVRKVEYRVPREPAASTHRYLIGTERAVLQGQEVWRACKKLRDEGFIPDIVCSHPGWGDTLYVKDAFPTTMLLSYFEFYYHFNGVDVNFDPELPTTVDDGARVRTKNIVNLMNLEAMDWGVSPTHWQHSLHPVEYQSRISVIHDGVDTDLVRPDPTVTLKVANVEEKLKKGDPVVTYVARNFEHYRGFHHFMRAVKIIQAERPDVQILAIGADQVSYGRPAPKGQTFRKMLIDELQPDMSRLHFVGQVPYDVFLKILQISAAHLYLTVPFVLSWSMIESMSVGCALIGSDTPPVREAVIHGKNGLLVDFFSPDAIARAVLEVLERPRDYEEMRRAARRTAVEQYDLKRLLPLQQRLIEQVARRELPPPVQKDIAALYDPAIAARVRRAS